MNITGFPVSVPLQVKDVEAGLPRQQAGSDTKVVSGTEKSADNQKSQLYGEEKTAGEQSGEGAVRTKRGFKIPGFSRVFPSKKPTIPSFVSGVQGNFKQTSTLGPRLPVSPPNTPGVTNFRALVQKSMNPAATGLGPPKTVVEKPKTFGDMAYNLVAADRLVKAGVFKTDTPLKTVVRDAFVGASINGLVSTPLSIGTYAGSVWTGETIKGNFTATTPVLPPVHQPALSQQANGVAVAAAKPAEQDAAMINLRVDNAETKFLYLANTTQLLAEGGAANALEKSPNWPTETNERLANMERLYDATEKNMQAIAEQNEFIFKPYKESVATEPKTVASRLDALDKRHEAASNFIGRMIAIRDLEVKGKESTA